MQENGTRSAEGKRRREGYKRGILWIVTVLFLVAMIFPFVILISGSLMGKQELSELYGAVFSGQSGQAGFRFF